MSKVFGWVLARAKEPSTWAGAAAIAAAFGQPAVAAGLGGLASVMAESKAQ